MTVFIVLGVLAALGFTAFLGWKQGWFNRPPRAVVQPVKASTASAVTPALAPSRPAPKWGETGYVPPRNSIMPPPGSRAAAYVGYEPDPNAANRMPDYAVYVYDRGQRVRPLQLMQVQDAAGNWHSPTDSPDWNKALGCIVIPS
jgi:hypothetical protein